MRGDIYYIIVYYYSPFLNIMLYYTILILHYKLRKGRNLSLFSLPEMGHLISSCPAFRPGFVPPAPLFLRPSASAWTHTASSPGPLACGQQIVGCLSLLLLNFSAVSVSSVETLSERKRQGAHFKHADTASKLLLPHPKELRGTASGVAGAGASPASL